MTTSRAPRDAMPDTDDSMLANAGPEGATAITGQPSTTAATGPCIRSAAEYASNSSPESSRILSAISKAVQ